MNSQSTSCATPPTSALGWGPGSDNGDLHFGVRAQAVAGGVQATLADRDRIDADDHVQFVLRTFGDGRQAFVCAVNPFGVQMDGAMVEGVRSTGGGCGGLAQGREDVDRSPDCVFQSRGRLEGDGYVVEVRIPFRPCATKRRPMCRGVCT